jgi:hypothetical protein
VRSDIEDIYRYSTESGSTLNLHSFTRVYFPHNLSEKEKLSLGRASTTHALSLSLSLSLLRAELSLDKFPGLGHMSRLKSSSLEVTGTRVRVGRSDFEWPLNPGARESRQVNKAMCTAWDNGPTALFLPPSTPAAPSRLPFFSEAPLHQVQGTRASGPSPRTRGSWTVERLADGPAGPSGRVRRLETDLSWRN